jgi:hypothetical protein
VALAHDGCRFTLTNAGVGAADVYRLSVTGGQLSNALVALKVAESQAVSVTTPGSATLTAVSESDPTVKASSTCKAP